MNKIIRYRKSNNHYIAYYNGYLAKGLTWLSAMTRVVRKDKMNGN